MSASSEPDKCHLTHFDSCSYYPQAYFTTDLLSDPFLLTYDPKMTY